MSSIFVIFQNEMRHKRKCQSLADEQEKDKHQKCIVEYTGTACHKHNLWSQITCS